MVVIVAVYSKKIGLPAYSSHSYSFSLTSEVADLGQVERESAKLYAILQCSVDRELENPGFVPEGKGNGTPTTRHPNGHGTMQSRSSGHANDSEAWACSDKQRDLILKIAGDHRPSVSRSCLPRDIFP